MQVLLVEDDAAIAVPLQEGLVRAGYDVDWVSTASELGQMTAGLGLPPGLV